MAMYITRGFLEVKLAELWIQRSKKEDRSMVLSMKIPGLKHYLFTLSDVV